MITPPTPEAIAAIRERQQRNKDKTASYHKSLWEAYADIDTLLVALAERDAKVAQLNQALGKWQADWATTHAELTESQREIEQYRMSAELCAADVAFFVGEPPYLVLLCSDQFYRATADAEQIPNELLAQVYAIYKERGEDGLLEWIASQRDMGPLPEVEERLSRAKEIYNELQEAKAELARLRAQPSLAQVIAEVEKMRDEFKRECENDDARGGRHVYARISEQRLYAAEIILIRIKAQTRDEVIEECARVADDPSYLNMVGGSTGNAIGTARAIADGIRSLKSTVAQQKEK